MKGKRWPDLFIEKDLIMIIMITIIIIITNPIILMNKNRIMRITMIGMSISGYQDALIKDNSNIKTIIKIWRSIKIIVLKMAVALLARKYRPDI